MNVYLSGFMAAGKTVVGRELAARLDCPFVDLDEAVERRAGRSIPEIFEAEGESGFRRLESRELRRVLASEEVVVALGGGTVLDPDNRALLRRRGTLVWLDTPRSTILARLAASSGRPLARDAQQVARLHAERRSVYRDCDLTIRPRSGETAPEIAQRLFERLGA